MEKRTKRKARAGKRQNMRRARVVREPVTPEPPAQVPQNRLRRTCFDCMFCVSSVVLWAQTLLSGFPMRGQCANQPEAPGQMRRIPLTPCRNFRRKPFRLDPPEPPNDKIRYIPLTGGLFAIVDAEDYEWLSKYKWQVQPSTNHGTYYAKRVYRGRLILMHREIMKPPRGMFVDHINGNGLDNRRCNLRICTPRQNSCNRSKQRNTRHKFIGVQPCGKHTYQATVMHNGKTHRAGTFPDEVEAAKARDRLARKLHGPYARLNVLPENPEAEGQ